MGTKENPGEFNCYAAAALDEPLFTLLARDSVAPDLVEEWAKKRIARDGFVSKKAQEALQCAADMRAWYAHRCSGINYPKE